MFCPATKNKICKSPCFGDRKNVAISVAWSSGVLYFITALSASLNPYMTHRGSCCVPSHSASGFWFTILIHGSAQLRILGGIWWPRPSHALPTSRPHRDRVSNRWLGQAAPGQMRPGWSGGQTPSSKTTITWGLTFCSAPRLIALRCQARQTEARGAASQNRQYQCLLPSGTGQCG